MSKKTAATKEKKLPPQKVEQELDKVRPDDFEEHDAGEDRERHKKRNKEHKDMNRLRLEQMNVEPTPGKPRRPRKPKDDEKPTDDTAG